jgi:hypothetical protein
VNGIQDWMRDVLISRGALLESDESGRMTAMLPSAVAASLGTDEWLSIDGGDPADWLERMERVLPAQPLLVEAQYRSGRPVPPIDASSVLGSQFAIQNGIWRLVEDTGATALYQLFTFRYTIDSDDRSSGIHTVCFNTDAGAAVPTPESFLSGVRDALAETSGLAVSDVVARWYRSAVAVSRDAIRKQVSQAEETATRRLARDTQRVEAYYAGLLAQFEKRIAKRGGDPAAVEKERTRAAATKADRAAKLEDLQRKYALRIRIEPALLLAVRAPVRRISVRLIRKKEERPWTLDWNPVLGVLEPPVCEHCSSAAHPLYLCERAHLLCRNCWPQCPACSRFFCRVCQRRCKCGAESGRSPAI